MNRQSWLLNLSLLKTHLHFAQYFWPVLSLLSRWGCLAWRFRYRSNDDALHRQVGLSVTLTGGAMFIGLMVGGVLADRYERKR